jgi:glucose-6-phosphate isomerase
MLVGLTNEVDLKGAINALFDGEIVNASEGRQHCTPPCVAQ